jgi:magnesium chelatase subunit I
MENLISNAERRALVTGEKTVTTRVCDLQQAVSAVSGKVELVLEGEQEGAMNVARALLGRGVKSIFAQHFPDAYKPKRRSKTEPPSDEGMASAEYRPVLEWFSSGNHIEIADDMAHEEFAQQLASVKGLSEIANKYLSPANPIEAAVAMELALEGLHQHSMLSRERLDGKKTAFKDMLKSMLSGFGED